MDDCTDVPVEEAASITFKVKMEREKSVECRWNPTSNMQRVSEMIFGRDSTFFCTYRFYGPLVIQII